MKKHHSPASSPPIRLVLVALLAIVILGVILISLTLIKLNPNQPAEVVFVQGVGAKFAVRGTPGIGEGLDAGKYVLTMGTIQLRLANGAEATIESPAAFRVNSGNRIILDHGIVLAMVPQTAHGFEMGTKLGTVRGLGTEFGVTVKQAAMVQVVVFQGEVELSRNGEPARSIAGGDGLSITPDLVQPLAASEHAYHYPRILPSSDAVSSSDNLVTNPSFEIGPLSRAPRASHRYRDIPSHWTEGDFFNHKWRKQVEGPGLVNAGTVVASFQGMERLRPAMGERCLFLDGVAVRQRIETPLPGGQYRLKLKVASPDQSTDASPPVFQVGFVAGSRWVSVVEGMVEPGSEFAGNDYVLGIPEDDAIAGKQIYLTLSSKSGLIYFDEIRLLPLSGGN